MIDGVITGIKNLVYNTVYPIVRVSLVSFLIKVSLEPITCIGKKR